MYTMKRRNPNIKLSISRGDQNQKKKLQEISTNRGDAPIWTSSWPSLPSTTEKNKSEKKVKSYERSQHMQHQMDQERGKISYQNPKVDQSSGLNSY